MHDTPRPVRLILGIDVGIGVRSLVRFLGRFVLRRGFELLEARSVHGAMESFP
jgi:hypothetical protein